MRVLTSVFPVIMMSLMAQIVNAADDAVSNSLPGSFPGPAGFPEPPDFGELPPQYPDWPERFTRTDIVPPPPGGPYMSSAMSEIDAFPADTGGVRNNSREQRMDSAFFSPDVPWPETPERDRPRAWMPESGEYHFVPEDIVRQLESPASVRSQGYPVYQPHRGYRPAPQLRQPYYGYR